MSCLDDSTLLRFVTGQLDEIGRARAEDELAGCRRCAAVVAEIVRGSSVFRVEPGWSDPEPDEPGPADEHVEHDEHDPDGPLARYTLGPVIARGGMGTILSALDRRLSRSIAIKRLDSDEPVLAGRFAREIRITASLQHPGVVPIYDSGVLPDGRPFYAMRHVPGATLEGVMRERRGADERLALLVPLLAAAEAVAYAHERGIMHRDLKPSNVLVGPFGETVVIDWGLAGIDAPSIRQPSGPEAADDAATTRDGVVLGTPRYMAPEQARGEPATLRSDVYALGALLYHALSGSPPVADDDVERVLERVARADVRPLATIAPGLPRELVDIVERAMAPSPEGRYSTAGELAADLRRFQTGQLVGAHAYSRRDLVRRFVRRHRTAVTLSALFAAILVAGGAMSARRIVGEREVAEEQRKQAERERAGAEDLLQFLLYDMRGKLSSLGRLDLLSGVADRVESYYVKTAAARAERPEVLGERAKLFELRAEVARMAGDGPAGERYVNQGVALLDRAPSTSRTDTIRASLLASRAASREKAGQFAEARALRLEALALFRKLGRSAGPAERRTSQMNLANELGLVARSAAYMGSFADAEREWDEATRLLESLHREDPDDLDAGGRLASLRMVVGQSRVRRGKMTEARSELERARAEALALAAREPRNTQFQYVVAWSSVALADIHAFEGDLSGAEKLRREVRTVAELVLEIEPANAIWRNLLARADMDLGRAALARTDWAAAAPRFEASARAYDELRARDPADLQLLRWAGMAWAQLAECEAALDRPARARSAWLSALRGLEEAGKSGQPLARAEWAFGLARYAEFERGAGKLAAAAQAIERGVALLDAAPADTDTMQTVYRAGVLAELGNVRAAQRRTRQARTARERAAALLRGLVAKEPRNQEWAGALREIEGKLAGRGARKARSALR